MKTETAKFLEVRRAPLICHDRASGRYGLRAVALFEAGKGALALLLGAVAWTLLKAQGSSAPENSSHNVWGRVLHALPALEARWIAVVVVTYATVRFWEAYGLWRGRAWAVWLAILSGGMYLPFEAWQLGRHFSWLMLAVLAVNLAVVGYVWQGRRCSRAEE